MMLELLETGKALYVLAAVCVLGILSRMTARSLYKRLIKQTDNMALTKNRCLRDLKQKAENTYRLNQGIQNTRAYLEKQLNGYRFLGLTLNGWGNLSGQFTILSFLLGGIAAFGSYWYRCDSYYIVLYGTAGLLSGLLTLFVDCGVNLGEQKNQLMNALQDYLENSLFHRLAREAASTLEGGARESGRTAVREIARDGSGRDNGIRELKVRDLNVRDSSTRDTLSRDPGAGEEEPISKEGIRNISRMSKSKLERSRSAKSGSGRAGTDSLIVEELEEEPGWEQPPKKTGRLSRKARSEESAPALAGDKNTPRRETDYLKHSLEQIAASREKGHGEGDWIKELSPNELELVGEILKQYLA